MNVACENNVDSVYHTEFEEQLLKQTKQYYSVECREFLDQENNSNTFPDYLKRIERRLLEEEQRAEIYFDASTYPKIVETCNEVMITNHLDEFKSKFESYLSEYIMYAQRSNELKRIYNLLIRLDHSIGLDVFKEIFFNHVYKTGYDNISQLDEKVINVCLAIKTDLSDNLTNYTY